MTEVGDDFSLIIVNNDGDGDVVTEGVKKRALIMMMKCKKRGAEEDAESEEETLAIMMVILIMTMTQKHVIIAAESGEEVEDNHCYVKMVVIVTYTCPFIHPLLSSFTSACRSHLCVVSESPSHQNTARLFKKRLLCVFLQTSVEYLA